mgnify:CR=1 FL=1
MGEVARSRPRVSGRAADRRVSEEGQGPGRSQCSRSCSGKEISEEAGLSVLYFGA